MMRVQVQVSKEERKKSSNNTNNEVAKNSKVGPRVIVEGHIVEVKGKELALTRH
jgi:hypothetical protein